MTRPAPYLCFYGDDFTGSTDVLDSLSSAGIRTILFPSLPDEHLLQKYGGADAIGIASMSRTMSPAAMAAFLPEIFRWMADTGAAILHYKVCSTFDSSPLVGSIGKVMDIAATELGASCIPLLIGVPKLGRYCVFGTLFARAGSNPDVFRLDRHPVMSRHPVTPMTEADLRRHLSLQTSMPVGLVPVTVIEARAMPTEHILRQDKCHALLFDTVCDDHLKTIGAWLHALAADSSFPLFCIGSSAVEYALAEQWPRRRVGRAHLATSPHRGVAPIAVVSGSCSPVTARQIDVAASHEFEPIHVSVMELTSADAAQAARIEAVRGALEALERGRSPLIYTAHGEANPAFREPVGTHALEAGRLLGGILKEVVDKAHLTRVAVAGGDTSGVVAECLQIEALEVAMPISPGAPLCNAHLAGGGELQVALKGGQMGSDDYFARVRFA